MTEIEQTWSSRYTEGEGNTVPTRPVVKSRTDSKSLCDNRHPEQGALVADVADYHLGIQDLDLI